MEKFNQDFHRTSLVSIDEGLVSKRFDYSTADVEASVFFGLVSHEIYQGSEEAPNISGVYKLIDEQLHAVVDTAPPNAVPLSKSSGLFKLAGE